MSTVSNLNYAFKYPQCALVHPSNSKAPPSYFIGAKEHFSNSPIELLLQIACCTNILSGLRNCSVQSVMLFFHYEC